MHEPDWTSPFYLNLLKEVEERGLDEPILVSGFRIIDGYARFKVCQKLGWTEIPTKGV